MDLAGEERPKPLSSLSIDASTKDQTVGRFLSIRFISVLTCHYRFSKVFFVNASSSSTIEADLSNIAVVEDIGSTHAETVDWLSGLREEWLLVFDNADDTALDFHRYFPSCSHGNMIITTRNVNLRIHARDSDRDTSRLSPADALNLFLRVSGLSCSDDDTKQHATNFLKVFHL